jgi:TfoX/Sxy family transcriptional regulator of competence genes
MASQQSTADYIIDQIRSAGPVSARKMFGEFGVFCDGRMIAVICDDRLFVRPTNAGRAYMDEVREEQPFPGAKLYFVVPEERWDDADWMAGLMRATTPEVPLPKVKKAKVKAPAKKTKKAAAKKPAAGKTSRRVSHPLPKAKARSEEAAHIMDCGPPGPPVPKSRRGSCSAARPRIVPRDSHQASIFTEGGQLPRTCLSAPVKRKPPGIAPRRLAT